VFVTEIAESHTQGLVDHTLLGPLPPFVDLNEPPGVRWVTTTTGDQMWLVSDYDLAKKVLRDIRFSRAEAVKPTAPRVAHALPSPDSITSMDGPEHTRLRRVVAGAFSQRRVAAMAPFVTALVEDLMSRMERGGAPADLAENLAIPLPLAVLSELLGIPAEDREQFGSWVDVLFDLTAADSADTRSRRIRLVAYMSRLIKRKRKDPGDDLLSELVHLRDAENGLTERELIHLGLALLMAGYDTTAGQISMTVVELLTDRGRYEELVRKPHLVDSAADEFLRTAPSTSISFPRVATADIEIGGVTIREGQGVVVSLIEANRDPSAFPPGIATPPLPHLTFGYGAHRCLGAHLAQLQVVTVLSGLVRRFPALHLALGNPIVWKGVMGARGMSRVTVTW
jgi:cytochrome P450